ncbi:MAG TPA: class I SAM-dependent methyltransferase [Nocardioidaceae bacterium]
MVVIICLLVAATAVVFRQTDHEDWALGALAVLIAGVAVLTVVAHGARRLASRHADEAAARREKRVVAKLRRLEADLRDLIAVSAKGHAATESSAKATAALAAEVGDIRRQLAALGPWLGDVRRQVAKIDSGFADASAEIRDSAAGLDRSIAAKVDSGFADASAEIRDSAAGLDRSIAATDWQVRKLGPDLLTDIQAMRQLFDRLSTDAPLPPVSGWALNPSGLLLLVDTIERSRATTIVECGSGTSTVWMALALRKLGRGRIWSFDHDKRFAERTRQMLAAHGLEEWAEVQHAPLVTTATPRGEFNWYDLDPLEITPPIDLLVVDGPPHTAQHHARYPALPVFAPYLAPDALIVVDDAQRTDEAGMVAHWQEEYPHLSTMYTSTNGCLLLRQAVSPPTIDNGDSA